MSVIGKPAFKINCNWLGFTHCCAEKSHSKDPNIAQTFSSEEEICGIRASIIFTKDIEEVLTDIILMLADNIKLERVLKSRKQKGKEKGNMERI